MALHVAVLSGFALAAAAGWVQRRAGAAAGWLLAVLPLGLALYFAGLLRDADHAGAITGSWAWVPGLGVNLSFYVDGLGLLFAILVTGIGALVLVYAGGYLAGRPDAGRFQGLTLAFMASMVGLVLAGNVIVLFVFWELTSIISYLLIGFDHERPAARAAALQALVVTGGGGLALLAGLLLLGRAAGTFEVAGLLAAGEAVRGHDLWLPILILVLIGAFTKSAQVPFHFWLPGAMEAPTPASAYLHSATMVKAGVYLLARLSPVMAGGDDWHYLVTGAGMATMLLGALMALREHDLKRILAYTTVSTLGALVLLLGMATTLSVQAAMLLLVVHALYKGALFLAAGSLQHEAGTRDLRRLGGLARAMPLTTAAAVLAALSMAGLPPMLGFIAKELLYEAKLQAPRAAGMITAAGVASNALLVASAALIAVRPFFGRRAGTPGPVHEAPPSMWLGPLALAAVGALCGLCPSALGGPLVSAAASAVRAEPSAVELSLWHGLSPVLTLSALTVLGGVAVYLVRDRLLEAARRPSGSAGRLLGALGRCRPEGCYVLALRVLDGLAIALTRVLQSGYLRFYLITVVLTTVGLAATALATRGPQQPTALRLDDIRPYEALVALLIVASAAVAVSTSSRLTAVAALGVVGYSVALIYTLFGAPDLAMTQFAIETLTVFLFVLVLYRLPRFANLSSRGARLRDAVVAIAAGATMTVLVLVGTTPHMASRLSAYYAQNALPLAHGRNIDNVILVDFRALDTLGEITVLAAAAIGVYALLKLRLDE